MAVRRVSASTAALSLPPSPTYSQESMSTPETKQSLSIPPIWLIAIAVLVVIVIIEAIIYFFLKAKKTKP
jgi:hypothetical protein